MPWTCRPFFVCSGPGNVYSSPCPQQEAQSFIQDDMIQTHLGDSDGSLLVRRLQVYCSHFQAVLIFRSALTCLTSHKLRDWNRKNLLGRLKRVYNCTSA